jgi:hypothetical protein
LTPYSNLPLVSYHVVQLDFLLDQYSKISMDQSKMVIVGELSLPLFCPS